MASSRALSIEDGNLSAPSTLNATANRKYIDVDMSFATKPVSGDVYKKTNAASVTQALKTLIMTNRTEKPFEPAFGANIGALLFELADVDTANDIKFAIRETIRVYEPRVDPDDLFIDVVVHPDYNSVELSIVFKIVNTNETVEFTTRLNRLR